MTLESTKTSIETTLNFLLECGSLQLKIMPLKSGVTWQGFIERQTTLDEYYDVLDYPDSLQGPPEITIHLNSKLLKEKEELSEVIREMCEYVQVINGKGWCEPVERGLRFT